MLSFAQAQHRADLYAVDGDDRPLAEPYARDLPAYFNPEPGRVQTQTDPGARIAEADAELTMPYTRGVQRGHVARVRLLDDSTAYAVVGVVHWIQLGYTKLRLTQRAGI